MDKNTKLQDIPLYKLIPSFITILSLCLGVTSIRYAFDAKWTIAAALIIIAALMDGLDGKIARFLNATSDFGAHLDSLADLVNFGVAPAIVVYLWSLHEIPYKGIGWFIVLLFIACSALRLARFNSETTDDTVFTGIPMPGAAVISLTPMILSFEIAPNISYSYWFTFVYMMLIGLGMISRIPTLSLKGVSIKKQYHLIVLGLIAFVTAIIVLEPWKILPIISVCYIISIVYYGIKSIKN